MGDITHLLVMLYFVISFFDSRFQCQPLVHFHTHTHYFHFPVDIEFDSELFELISSSNAKITLLRFRLHIRIFFESIFDLSYPKSISFFPSKNFSLFIQNFRTIVLSVMRGWNIWIWMKKKARNTINRIQLNGYWKYLSRSPTLSEVSIFFSISFYFSSMLIYKQFLLYDVY